MPTITGNLMTIAGTSPGVQEIWARAYKTTPDGTGLRVTDAARFQVTAGKITMNLQPGPGFLVPVRSGVAGEAIPILVTATSKTLADIVHDGADFPTEQATTIADLATDAKKAVAAAKEIANHRAAISNDTKTLVTKADATKTEADRAAIMLTEINTQHKQLAVMATDLSKWQPQYDWLKNNFATISERLKTALADPLSLVRSELSTQVKAAQEAQKAAQTSADKAAQEAIKAASGAQDAVSSITAGAPTEYNTLKKIADRIKPEGDLEISLLEVIGERALENDFRALEKRFNAEKYSIGEIQGIPTGVTSATHDPTPNTLVSRDANGRFAVARPVRNEDAVPKSYVEGVRAQDSTKALYEKLVIFREGRTVMLTTDQPINTLDLETYTLPNWACPPQKVHVVTISGGHFQILPTGKFSVTSAYATTHFTTTYTIARNIT